MKLLSRQLYVAGSIIYIVGALFCNELTMDGYVTQFFSGYQFPKGDFYNWLGRDIGGFGLIVSIIFLYENWDHYEFRLFSDFMCILSAVSLIMLFIIPPHIPLEYRKIGWFFAAAIVFVFQLLFIPPLRKP